MSILDDVCSTMHAVTEGSAHTLMEVCNITCLHQTKDLNIIAFLVMILHWSWHRVMVIRFSWLHKRRPWLHVCHGYAVAVGWRLPW